MKLDALQLTAFYYLFVAVIENSLENDCFNSR